MSVVKIRKDPGHTNLSDQDASGVVTPAAEAEALAATGLVIRVKAGTRTLLLRLLLLGSPFLNRMTAPIISLLRPVSPLAWLPVALYVLKEAQLAATWAIFISSIWPMILNTAVGISKVPQDFMNVARVLNLSEWTIFSKILFPATLPYVMTGGAFIDRQAART